MSSKPLPSLDATSFAALVHGEVPLAAWLGLVVDRFDVSCAVIRLPWQTASLRPGGSVSGPAMMTLSDVALWAAILARIGKQPLCVTTDLTFHFLAKPRDADVLATARVLRLGRRQAVAEATLTSMGLPVAHAVGTYAIPGDRGSGNRGSGDLCPGEP